MSDPTCPTYRVLSAAEKAAVERVKAAGAELIAAIRLTPQSRETALAITRAEEAVMWAVKGITA